MTQDELSRGSFDLNVSGAQAMIDAAKEVRRIKQFHCVLRVDVPIAFSVPSLFYEMFVKNRKTLAALCYVSENHVVVNVA